MQKLLFMTFGLFVTLSLLAQLSLDKISPYLSQSSLSKMFVAVGTYSSSYPIGTIAYAYASDITTWTTIPDYTGYNAVASNGKMFVAVGNNILKYSFDGINWKTSSSGSSIGNLSCVFWTGKKWFVGGISQAWGYSYNGINWTTGATGSSPSTVPTDEICSICIGKTGGDSNEYIFMFGSTGYSFSSDGGLTWTGPAYIGESSQYRWYSAVYEPYTSTPVMLAIGYNPAAAYATSNSSWEITDSSSGWAQGESPTLCFLGPYFLVSDRGRHTSDYGATWTDPDTPPQTGTWLGACYNGDIAVLVGYTATENKSIAYSVDVGLTWTTLSSSILSRGKSICTNWTGYAYPEIRP